MLITQVFFRAFDRDHDMVFMDKSPEQIHRELLTLCNTYEPSVVKNYEIENPPEPQYPGPKVLTDLRAVSA